MKALVKYKKGSLNVRIEDIPKPEPGPNEVRIKIKMAGICGTDIHIYNDDSYPVIPPVIMGHEACGVIDALGEEVKGFCTGDRVVTETYYFTCGKCYYCKTGRNNLCPERLSIGSGVNGVFAEYVVVPTINLHYIPENVSFEEAAFTEPLACCTQAVMEKARILPQDYVLITGPGTIGLLCLQLAKACGCKCIVTGGPKDAKRLEMAKELGADLTFMTSENGIEDSILKYCDNIGPNTILECSGNDRAINFCLNVIRKGGRYVQVGLTGGPISMDINKVTLKEINVVGTFAQKWEWWEKSIKLLEDGVIKTKPLITEILPIDKWESAFNNHMSGAGLKYLLFPDDSK